MTSRSTEHLVQMANDIADYFQAEPETEAAVAGVVGHITRFWEPRMRRKLLAHLDAGGDGLSELSRRAAEALHRDAESPEQPATPPPPVRPASSPR